MRASQRSRICDRALHALMLQPTFCTVRDSSAACRRINTILINKDKRGWTWVGTERFNMVGATWVDLGFDSAQL